MPTGSFPSGFWSSKRATSIQFWCSKLCTVYLLKRLTSNSLGSYIPSKCRIFHSLDMVNELSMDTRFTTTSRLGHCGSIRLRKPWLLLEKHMILPPKFGSCLHSLDNWNVAKTKDRHLHKINYSCQGGRKQKMIPKVILENPSTSVHQFYRKKTPNLSTCRTKGPKLYGCYRK